MAIREYIGARYVPRFMGEYDVTQVYEALDIVDNGLGTTYISKIPTPAGTPLTDTEHWAIYGASSGAVINLQNQIDTINNTTIPGVQSTLQGEIDTINNTSIPGVQSQIDTINNTTVPGINSKIGNLSNLNTDDKSSLVAAINERKNIKKVLFVGDSYNVVVPDKGWDLTFITLAGLSSDDYYRVNIAGSGFTTSPNWYTNVYNRLTLIDDKELYSDVIVCGGANDAAATFDSIIAAMSQFKQLIEANFPNAKLSIGFIGYTGLPGYHSRFREGCENYKKACQSLGIRYLHNVEWTLFWKPYLTDNTAENPYDYIHPNANGLTALGVNIYQAFISGSCDVRYSAKATFTASGDSYNFSNEDFVCTIENGSCFIDMSKFFFAMNTNTSAGGGKTVATFTSDLFNPHSLMFTVPYRLPSVADSSANTIVVFGDGVMSIAPMNAVPASTQMSLLNYKLAISSHAI